VAHSPAWRSSLACYEANDWQVSVVVVLDPLCRLFFSFSADLTNEDDSLGLLVSHKSVKDINEVGTIEGVTSNADHSRLTKTCVCGLLDSLVSQGA
jgi:hypothetical protein